MQPFEQMTLNTVNFIFDGYFNLYPTPVRRRDAQLQIVATVRNYRQTFALWCLQIITFLHKLVTLLYRSTTGDISGYVFLHFIVLSHTTMGLLCAMIFRLNAEETLTYFRYSYSLRQQFAGGCKQIRLHLISLETEFLT